MNAIILAAGVGLRFRDVAKRGHKAFLPIGGMCVIERTINYLKEAGIEDITIVTGHKKELFQPLEKEYGVTLLYNRKYATNNNLHSLELVLDKIGDTFLIHSDVILFKNLFKEESKNSFFYTVFKEPKGMPVFHPIVNKQRIIESYETYTGKETITTLLGISYWAKEDVSLIRSYFETMVDDKLVKKFHLEWDQELVKYCGSKNIEAHQIDRKYAKDINTMNDYLEANYIYDRAWKKKR